MHSFRYSLLCAGALTAASSSNALAQLVFGSTTSNTANPCAMYLDVNTMQVTTLWNSASNKKVNGLAADPASSRLYSNDAARLNFWNYGSVGTTPTFIAGMYRTNDNISFTATGVDGMAWANGNLYGVTNFGSTVFKRGIYQINTTPDAGAHCVMTPLWLDPTGVGTSSGTISLGGVEYNNDNGLFYITNAADTTGIGGTYTPGVFTIDAFGSGAITKVTDFPVGHTRIDGMAIGAGKIWMTEQDATNSRIGIFPYDLATNTYLSPIYVPLADTTNRATGACWAPGALPEPATLSLLALGGWLALRRR